MKIKNTGSFVTPVARLVQGNCAEPQKSDAEGNPLIIKNGPNQGQPRISYFMALAIPKSGKSWMDTEWGKVIYQTALTADPNLNIHHFAFKVIDGDSKIPNKRGIPPCEKIGFKGCWVLRASGGFAPICVDSERNVLKDPSCIMLGDYVTVSIKVKHNNSNQQPGVFLNPTGVRWVSRGKRIPIGPTPEQLFDEATPVVKYKLPDGGVNTRDELITLGYEHDAIDELPVVYE